MLWTKENNERFAAQHVQFNHDVFSNKIKFFKQPQRDDVWFLDCYVELLPTELVQIDWVVRWTIAEAKIMLGAAYKKFSSLSGPTGEFQLPGNELVQEGRDEKNDLLEEIAQGIDGNQENSAMEIYFG
jgi:hypothetical protein